MCGFFNIPCEPIQRKCRRWGLGCIILVQEDYNVLPFVNFIAKAAHSPQLFEALTIHIITPQPGTLQHNLTRWQYVCCACTYYYTIDQAMYFATDMFTFLSFPWLVNKARAFPSLTYTFSIIKSPWRDHEIHVKLPHLTTAWTSN